MVMATDSLTMHDSTTSETQPLGVNPAAVQRRRRKRRSDRLLSALEAYDQIVLLMHNNPDPDAIASGWALKFLIEEKLDKPTRLVGGGTIVRAENRYLVELLKPPLELVDDLRLDPGTGVILVDCGIDAANHLQLGAGCGELIGVIDHHRSSRRRRGLPFQDIRPKLAASATITAGYLREQDLTPDRFLATALLYAMKTETRGCQTYFSATDRAMLPWLTRWADPHLLAEIEDSPLPIEYYGDVLLALQSTLIYGDSAFCLLPRAQGAEIVGEIADLLVRCEGIHRVFCGALVDHHIAVSIRTSSNGGDASTLVSKTLEGIGHGGGHSNRAGGIIPAVDDQGNPIKSLAFSEALQAGIRDRWLRACGLDDEQPRRLISLDEIVNHL